MGGLIGKNQQNKKEYVKANKVIGREMKCNTCGKIFSAHTNLNLFNNHINNCFQINRERDRIENLLNDLRETNLEIEQLEKIKRKKKEAEIKKTKKEKINKQINTNKINNIFSNNEILINPSDLIFMNPNMIFNNQFDYNNNNNFILNTNEDEIEKLNLSDIDTNSLKELPFEEKLEFFRSYVKNLKVDWRQGSCTLEIDREDCFRQSMIQFERIDPFKELKINFRGEVSHDAGGLIREWYSIVFKHILSPGTKLFEKSDSDEYSFRFSRFINPSIETLDIMFFIGKIVAKALLDNLTINTCFNKIIYKMLLNESITLDDLVFIDKPLYNSLKEMKKIEKLDNLGIYFNVEYILNGKLVSEDLIPNGSNIHVSKDNLEEYIKKRIEHMQIKEKNFINEMKNGMLQILPEKLIEIFNSDELELFINGYPFIDLDDWKANTEYKGFNPNDEIIINFWDIMNKMSQKELSTFLQFCTGSSRVPIGGFETIESNRGNIAKFCITKSTLTPGKNFIRAHTCFNRLDLPEFKNKRDLQEAMNFVAENEILGFGMD